MIEGLWLSLCSKAGLSQRTRPRRIMDTVMEESIIFVVRKVLVLHLSLLGNVNLCLTKLVVYFRKVLDTYLFVHL